MSLQNLIFVPAHAQDSAAPAAAPSAATTATTATPTDAGSQPKGPSMFEQMVPMIFVVVVFYLLVIRPQGKKQKEHAKFITELKKGDNVVTNGGILGKVNGITEKFVTLEVSDGVSIRILKSQIATTLNEGATNA